jgi:hypothetical protein
MTAQPSPFAQQFLASIAEAGYFIIDQSEPSEPDERVIRALQELMNLGLVRKAAAFVPSFVPLSVKAE